MAAAETPFQFIKSSPFAKVDEQNHVVYGIATEQIPDKEDECCMYDASKPAWEAWSREQFEATTAAGQEPSLGNIRIQHDVSQLGGKAVRIDYDDPKKQIRLGAEPASDAVWDLIRKGVLSGFSQAGNYAWRRCAVCNSDILVRGNWCAKCEKNVTVNYAIDSLAEVSLVDNPCLQTAHFLYIKSDGSQELRKIVPRDPESVIHSAMRDAKAAAASFADAAKRTPQAPDGKFTPRASGEMHDCLTAAGFEHRRSGSLTEGDATDNTATYCHASGSSVTVTGDNWEHNDGHGRCHRGSGLEALQSHLESCKGVKAVRELRDYLKKDWTQAAAESALNKSGFSVLDRSETFDAWRFVVKFSAGCVMIPIPPDSEPGRKMAELRSKIDPQHLAGKGLEAEPHITARYGFTGGIEDIVKYVQQQNPFIVTFGGTAAFEPTEHSDHAAPLHVKVASEDLTRINAELALVGEWKEANFDYNPHATLAYLSPDYSQQYVGYDEMQDLSFNAEQIIVAPADGEPHVINLKPKGEQKSMGADALTITEISGVKRLFGESADVFVKRATDLAVKSVHVMPTFEVEQFRRAARGEDPGFTDEQQKAFGELAALFKAEKKTKRVAGEDLTADCFIYVGDPQDISTWALPWKFSTEEKTKLHLRNAVARFDQTSKIPESEKDAAWKKLVRLCKEHDIDVSDDADKTVVSYQFRKAEIELAKSMYDVSDLAQLLQAIYWIKLRQEMEGEYEHDEDNFAIAGRLSAWLADGVDILKEMVEEETAELTEPALKAALGKGASKMKEVAEMLKAVKGFTGHFKAAMGHHEHQAAHHLKIHKDFGDVAGQHDGMHEEHKAMHEHHNKMAGHHAADRVLADHHKAMAAHHAKKAEHHSKMAAKARSKAESHHSMHKSHDGMCQHCKAMCDHLDGTDKALKALEPAAADPNQNVASDAMTKALEKFTETMARVEKALDPETMKKAMKDVIDAQPAPLPAGLTLVPRPGMSEALTKAMPSEERDASGGLKVALAK